jgi:hypothetical protein
MKEGPVGEDAVVTGEDVLHHRIREGLEAGRAGGNGGVVGLARESDQPLGPG